MIDFKQEISKYKPVVEVENVEKSINDNDINDIMNLLIQLTNNKKNLDKE